MTAATESGDGTYTPPHPAEDSRRWLGLTCISVAQLMVALDATVINIALPSAQRALRHLRPAASVGRHRLHARLRRPASSSAAGSPTRSAASARSCSGWLGFAAASAAGGAAPHFGALVAARAVQGACAALLAPTAALAARA